MKDLRKEIIKKITFKVFDKETNSYVEEWKCFSDGINKDGVLCVPTYEKSLSPVSKQFEYHIQEELYTKEEVEKIKLQERKKTLEEVIPKMSKLADKRSQIPDSEWRRLLIEFENKLLEDKGE